MLFIVLSQAPLITLMYLISTPFSAGRETIRDQGYTLMAIGKATWCPCEGKINLGKPEAQFQGCLRWDFDSGANFLWPPKGLLPTTVPGLAFQDKEISLTWEVAPEASNSELQFPSWYASLQSRQKTNCKRILWVRNSLLLSPLYFSLSGLSDGLWVRRLSAKWNQLIFWWDCSLSERVPCTSTGSQWWCVLFHFFPVSPAHWKRQQYRRMPAKRCYWSQNNFLPGSSLMSVLSLFLQIQ